MVTDHSNHLRTLIRTFVGTFVVVTLITWPEIEARRHRHASTRHRDNTVFQITHQQPRFVVISPNIYRLDVEETVLVTVHGAPEEREEEYVVTVEIQDAFGWASNHPTQVTVTQVSPAVVRLKVDPSQASEYVWLRLSYDGRELERRKVLVSLRTGFVLVQSDKTLYTPGQEVKIRVMTLDEDLKPSRRPINLAILNHNSDVAVRWTDLRTDNGFLSKLYRLPDTDQFGNWTVTASYSSDDQLTIQTKKFQVKKYALPSFTLSISYPSLMILPNDTSFNFTITARFTHGSPVDIRGHIGVGLVTDDDQIEAVRTFDQVDFNGTGTFFLNLSDVSGVDHHRPGSRLRIEAYLHDHVTGEPQSLTDERVWFRDSPYRLTFDGTRKFFHPGMSYEIQIQVRTYDNDPVRDKPVALLVESHDRSGELVDTQSLHGTTESGGETFTSVNVFSTAYTMLIKASIGPGNSSVHMRATRFTSEYSSTRVTLVVRHQGIAKVTDPKVDVDIVLSARAPNDMLVHCLVVVRGRILVTEIVRLPAGTLEANTSLRTLYAMTPSFRLVAFHVTDQGQVIADSIWIDVHDDCYKPLSIMTDQGHYKPRDEVMLALEGEASSTVSLTATDTSVYWLSRGDGMTKQKLYEWLETFDLGKGSGRGSDNAHVFKDSGLMVVSNVNIDVAHRDTVLKHDPTYWTDGYRFPGRGDPAFPGGRGPAVPGVPGGRKIQKRDLGNRQRRTRVDGRRNGAPRSALQRRCCRLAVQHARSDATTECFLMAVTRAASMETECRYAYEKCCRRWRQRADSRRRPGGRGGNYGDFSGLGVQTGRRQHFPGVRNARSLMHDFQVRTFFPETWLFTLVHLDEDGFAQLSETVPDTITSWMIQAVSISPNHGLCVAQPHNVIAKKPVYVKLEVPRASVIGEQLDVRATVYNNLTEGRNVTVSLKGDISFCSGLEDGVLGHHEMSEIEAGQAQTFAFTIVPLQAGVSNVTVQLQTWDYVDIVQKSVIVRAPGKPTDSKPCTIRVDPDQHPVGTSMRYECGHVNYTLDDEGQPTQLVQLDGAISDRFYPGTEAARIRLMGDPLASVIAQLNHRSGLHGLVKLPQHCGEQNLIVMAPLVYVKPYLSQTGQLTDDISERIDEFIVIGYGNILAYKNMDGGFSVFPHEAPSTWLSAFAAKTLCKAASLIEDNVGMRQHGCDAMRWIADLQQNPNGEIVENSRIRQHPEMEGQTTNGPVTFTAFTLLAHQECSCDRLPANFEQNMVSFLLSEDAHALTRGGDIYQLAILAYALSFYRQAGFHVPVALTALMDKVKHTDTGLYWRIDGKPDQPTAVEIETAAYAALALMAVDNDRDAGKVLSWMNSYRNYEGGFISTQDTVVALHALSEYHRRNDHESMSLRVQITTLADQQFSRRVAMDENNRLLVNTVDQIPVGDDITVKISGTGSAELSFDLQYNQQAADDKCEYFNLYAKAKEVDWTVILDERARMGFHGRALYAIAVVDVVVQYSIKMPYTEAGMSILDVQIPTGYETSELEQVEKMPDVQKVVRTDTGVFIYLERVTNQSQALVIRTKQYNNRKLRPVSVKLYDYYESAKTSCTVFYHPSNSGEKLCSYRESSDICECEKGVRCTNCEDDPDYEILRERACSGYMYSFSAKVMNISTDPRTDLVTITLKVNYPIRPINDTLIQRDVIVILKKYADCDCPVVRSGQHMFIMANKRYLVRDFTNGIESVAITLNRWTYALPWDRPTGRGNPNRRHLYGKLARFDNTMRHRGCALPAG